MSVFDEGCDHGVVGFCTACDDALRIRRLKASLAAAKKERDEAFADLAKAEEYGCEENTLRLLAEKERDEARIDVKRRLGEIERLAEANEALEQERETLRGQPGNFDSFKAMKIQRDEAIAREQEQQRLASRWQAASEVRGTGWAKTREVLARVQARLAKVEEVAQDARDVCLGLVNLDDLEAALGSPPPDTYIYTPPHASEHAGEVVTVRGRGKFKTARMAALGWVETVEYLGADGERYSRPVAEFESLFVKQTKEGT